MPYGDAPPVHVVAPQRTRMKLRSCYQSMTICEASTVTWAVDHTAVLSRVPSCPFADLVPDDCT